MLQIIIMDGSFWLVKVIQPIEILFFVFITDKADIAFANVFNIGYWSFNPNRNLLMATRVTQPHSKKYSNGFKSGIKI